MLVFETQIFFIYHKNYRDVMFLMQLFQTIEIDVQNINEDII